MKKYINKTTQNLVKSVLDEFPELTYNALNKLLRKKDIKINGKRTNSNIVVNNGDVVEVYFDFDKVEVDCDIIYQDDNIAVVNKPQGIEVQSDGKDLTKLVSQKLDTKAYPCHRLDLNTQGLVVFAKTKHSEKLMLEVFKNHQLDKYYLALLCGIFNKKESVENAFIFKDNKKAQSFVYDTHKPNTKSIQTKYRVLKELDDASIVQIQIPTGRTHQIRAHMSYLGHAVVGDQKYGDVDFNKKYSTKKQMLCAYKLVFNLPQDHEYSYLNQIKISIKPSFLQKLNVDVKL